MTKLVLFSDSSKFNSKENYEIFVGFAKRHFGEIYSIIDCCYQDAEQDLSRLAPHARRSNSRPVRVNENIAQMLAQEFPSNFREISHKRFMLYFPEFAQFRIVKTNNGKLTPRNTKQAQGEIYQQDLPFSDCPILHIGHDHKYGHTSVTLMLFNSGVCVWSYSLNDIKSESQASNNITINQISQDTKTVFAKPKQGLKKKQEAL